MNAAPDCPLCAAKTVVAYHRDRRREYLRCRTCELVFVPPHQFLSADRERAEYQLHRNDPADAGYRAFLGRMLSPMLERLPAASSGLDFGCGPGPALALMFAERGHRVAVYDPFFADDKAVLRASYDFITATEVVEHLHRPGVELERLWSMLRPGGWLGIMTKRVENPQAFARWHYKNDLTHVSFFSLATFRFLAGRWQAELDVAGKDVVIFRKPGW